MAPSVFCVDKNLKICDTIEEEEKMDDMKRLGKVLKEGPINVQDPFEEWRQCHIVISERVSPLSFRQDKRVP